MHEVPTILAHFALPQRTPDEPVRELVFGIRPGGEQMIVQAATGESVTSFPIPAEPTVELAREMLRQFRPDLAAMLDAAERRQLLRLVGGADGSEAA